MENKTTPKDFFLHISSVVTLYVSVVSLVNLLFSIINKVFPDQLEVYYRDPYAGALRIAIASLLIVFPLYLVLARFINRDIELTPAKADIWPRKWFTYLTIFLAGLALAIDLIVLVNAFLGGELTIRFLLKILTLLIVIGLVFMYYITDLRKGMNMTAGDRRMWRIIAIVAVALSLITGFVVLGSPMTARKMRLDDQKTSDLQQIQWQIVNYWQQKEKLPMTFTELKDPISGQYIPKDVQFGRDYEYKVVDGDTFSLCAQFNLPSEKEQSSISKPISYGGEISENWQHPAGTHCFERTIDPQRYPPFSKTRSL
jgi:hypothetical protein